MEPTNKIPPLLCIRLFSASVVKYLLTFGFILVLSVTVSAQFTDSFSDGDFTNNPTWSTDVPANWTIDTNRLRSNSALANSTFFISTPSVKVTNAQWEFYTNLQFNTSSNNYVDVYLVSANENLLDAGNNGYFVRIGGTPDEVSLYKIVNGTASIIINGTDGVTNFSNNILKIKVTRDGNSLWTLAYDKTGTGNNYFSEPQATDITFSMGNYFGIRIAQSTSSFFNRHFFDDFYVGEIIVDNEPPSIVSATPLSATNLAVLFSEKVESSTAQTVTNYNVNNGIGQPQSATLQSDERTVHLQFSSNFPNGLTNQLTVMNVTDLSGNPSVSATANFFFFQPLPVNYKDVIITEIFADPSPIIGLPDAEFVELYNRSSNPVNLNGWKFSDPSSTATLPTYILQPLSYVIVTATASAPLFTALGQTIGVSNFPTLNNSSDNLTLKNSGNVIIDAVNYFDTWYKDDDKRQGGWTLELIDAENICAEEENWVASVHTSGGTPGNENSVNANKPDVTGPKLLSAIPISSTQLRLVFNEKLEQGIPAADNFKILPSIPVVAVSFGSSSLREIVLELSGPIQVQQTYQITANMVRDCSGNIIQEDFNTVHFGFPETASAGEVGINEILFNPRPFGVDFLEIVNHSKKYINLKDWSIGNYESGAALNLKPITTSDFLLAPESILAFSIDPLTIKSHYPGANLQAILKVSAMPSFPDSEGSVSILDNQGVVLDNFRYTKDMHSVFLRDKEGVSLERIHTETPTEDPNNWKSAASVVGFATPGYRNSNEISTQQITGEINIEPKIFIPIFGQPDFTQIKYNFQHGGQVANIKIIDHQGREVKRIANNETLATNGFYRWDGDGDHGGKVRPGYYVVWIEVFDASGKVETFRKRVVVASR